ncbi:hypothetical protein Tco_0401022 [Tanacetum coccineum]
MLASEGSSETTTEGYMENYKNVSQDIRDQLNAEAEAVQIILIGIDNDIYSTVDARPNACEMFYKMMNEVVRNQCDVTNHQVNVQFLLRLQPEWQSCPLSKQGEYICGGYGLSTTFKYKDYALEDVIESGTLFQTAAKSTQIVVYLTTLIPSPVTTEEKVQRR